MDRVQQPVARPFNPQRAVLYGQFVDTAYSMYESAPSNPTPSPPSAFPADYKLVAWVQMRDFVVEEGNWTFYGLIAQSTSKPNEYVLAIRGTENLIEWWDDLTSMVAVPLPNFGEVAYGFQRIYRTLRVVDYSPPQTLGAAVSARSLEAAGTFADQVAAAIQRHAAAGERPSEATAPSAVKSIEVTGHSLGAALATLYVAENAVSRKVATPLICTFASPRVGDSVFKTKFDDLGITSWRIVNELDAVPKLPFLGFWHVEKEELYNSGPSVDWSLACWHSLSTYLHLLDPKQPLSPECRWPQKPLATAPLRPSARRTHAAATSSAQAEKEMTLSVPPDHGATINITIKIGKTD
jgi:Lipase (class 3)